MRARAFTDFLAALLGTDGLAQEAEALPELLGVFLLGLHHFSLPAAEVLPIAALHFLVFRAESCVMGIALFACAVALAVASERSALSSMTWVFANLAMKYPHRSASEVYAVAVLLTRTFVSRVAHAGAPQLSLLELLVAWVFVLFLVHFQSIMLLITLLSVPALESVLTFNLVSFTKDGISTNIATKLLYIAITLFPFVFLVLLLLYLIRYTRLDKQSIQEIAFILTSFYSITLGEEWAIFVLGPLMLVESLRNMGYLKFLFAVGIVAEVGSCFEKDKPDSPGDAQPSATLKAATPENTPLSGPADQDSKDSTDKKPQTPNLKPPQTTTKPKEKQAGLWSVFFSLGWLFEGGSEKRTFRSEASTSDYKTELTQLIAIFWPVFDAYIYRSNGRTREAGTGFNHHLFPLYVCGIAHPLVASSDQASLFGRHFGSIRNFNGSSLEDAAVFLLLTLHFSSTISSCALNWDRVAVPLAMTAMRLTEKRGSNPMLPLSLVSFYYAYSLSLKYAKPVSLEK